LKLIDIIFVKRL